MGPLFLLESPPLAFPQLGPVKNALFRIITKIIARKLELVLRKALRVPLRPRRVPPPPLSPNLNRRPQISPQKPLPKNFHQNVLLGQHHFFQLPILLSPNNSKMLL